ETSPVVAVKVLHSPLDTYNSCSVKIRSNLAAVKPPLRVLIAARSSAVSSLIHGVGTTCKFAVAVPCGRAGRSVGVSGSYDERGVSAATRIGRRAVQVTRPA